MKAEKQASKHRDKKAFSCDLKEGDVELCPIIPSHRYSLRASVGWGSHKGQKYKLSAKLLRTVKLWYFGAHKVTSYKPHEG